MWGTCKIVNFSWLLFSTLLIGQNLLTQKNTLSKWIVNAFYCVNGLHVGLCILCVKMRTFLLGKAPLPYNKRNCYPPFPDHYLICTELKHVRIINMWSYTEILPLPLQYINSSKDNFTHSHPKLIVANYV